jgi:hypothetical protein
MRCVCLIPVAKRADKFAAAPVFQLGGDRSPSCARPEVSRAGTVLSHDAICLESLLVQNHSPGAVPWLRQLVAGFPLRRPGFEPSSSHVGFVVDQVALGQVFL